MLWWINNTRLFRKVNFHKTWTLYILSGQILSDLLTKREETKCMLAS